MINIIGKGGISAEIVCDSISKGQRLTTFRLHYHRLLHGELNTHRVFSRNASSSRAVPTTVAADMVLNNPAMPIFYGANQAGMKAERELDAVTKDQVSKMWIQLAEKTATIVKSLHAMGLHKQHAARPLESFQFMNTIVTATDFENFFWLRDDEDAQPEIQELAQCMIKAREQSTPFELFENEWHLPFITLNRDTSGILHYLDDNGNKLTLEEAQKISASVCAQVSYRKSDSTLDKAMLVWERLISGTKKHASPVEHQATPVPAECVSFAPSTWADGITHVNKDGVLCSGNFRNWIQFRQLMPGQAKW